MKSLFVLTALSLSAQVDFQTETRVTKPGAASKLVSAARYRTQALAVRVDKADRFVIVRLAEDRAQRADAVNKRYVETSVRALRKAARTSVESFTDLPAPPPIQWNGKTLHGIACRTSAGTITAYPIPPHPKYSEFGKLLGQLGLLEHPAQPGCAAAGTLHARITLTTDQGEFTTEITSLSDNALDPNIFQIPAGWRRSHDANLFKKL